MDEKVIAFTPLSNYILIDVAPMGEESKIIIPDTAKAPANRYVNIVAAISPEKEKDGTPMVRNVKVGDRVILSPHVVHTGSEIKIQGKLYIVCRESDIIGTLQDGWEVGNEVEDVKPKLQLVN